MVPTPKDLVIMRFHCTKNSPSWDLHVSINSTIFFSQKGNFKFLGNLFGLLLTKLITCIDKTKYLI